MTVLQEAWQQVGSHSAGAGVQSLHLLSHTYRQRELTGNHTGLENSKSILSPVTHLFQGGPGIC